MSGYDPFTRGPFPVGVRTVVLARGGRALPVELWYPATDEYAGSDVAESTRDTYQLIPGFPLVWQEAVRDATARPGRHALVVFSHDANAQTSVSVLKLQPAPDASASPSPSVAIAPPSAPGLRSCGRGMQTNSTSKSTAVARTTE